MNQVLHKSVTNQEQFDMEGREEKCLFWEYHWLPSKPMEEAAPLAQNLEQIEQVA